MDIVSELGAISGAGGAMWLYAAVAFVLASACEGAKPEGGRERGPIGIMPGLAALIAPLLLLVHAFWAVAPRGAETDASASQLVNVISLMPQPTLIALGLIAVVLIVAPSILGALLRMAPERAREAIYYAAPWLSAAALAFAVFVTHRSVAEVIDLAVMRPA